MISALDDNSNISINLDISTNKLNAKKKNVSFRKTFANHAVPNNEDDELEIKNQYSKSEVHPLQNSENYSKFKEAKMKQKKET